ncbi:tetratricopeptide repeat protein [Nitrospina watsonii]|uniref:TPR_REGION domain-containing protein n=1 Tax=Nitrospina watsonii TaxID=1323948 RepID=A0ABN8VZP6_9BACT|nr:tetratricopeptide repeat protein [Nitrospina watsonii]CAI2719225.1 TPR_REGION domain-containing protein [Nitrospina watsonii]
MVRWNKFEKSLGCLMLGVCLLLGGPAAANAQNGSGPIKIQDIELGPHPDKTRVIIHLNRLTEYRVIPDLANKRLGIFLRGAVLHPRIQPQVVKDIHLSKMDTRELEGIVKITLYFHKSNTQFIHFTENDPARIVVDLAEMAPLQIKQSKAKLTPEPKPETRKQPRIKGMTSDQIERKVQAGSEDKLRSGWNDYTRALNLFQQQKYAEAIPALKAYVRDFSASPYAANAAYLIAEAEWKVAIQKQHPSHERVIDAYRFAIRKYPDSRFYDHALYKLASIYDDLDLILEAKTHYEQGIERNPRSRYNEARKLGLARMMYKEGRLEEAYRAFRLILKDQPTEPKARASVYDIAQTHYEKGEFDKSLRVFEDAVERWPKELNTTPQLNYTLAELYFSRQQYGKARAFYFRLVNLQPGTLQAHQALNRIGDSYLLEKNGMAAYSVFERSQKIEPEGPNALYAKIRLADIGIRYPGLAVPDLVMENPAYFKPYQTYDKVFADTPARNIRSEVLLSRGSALFQEQRFLQSIQEFKRLLDRDKSSRFYRTANNAIHRAMSHLIDQYSKQGGHLPILYAYNDFLTLGIGDLDNLKTQLQIGEAYQAIGMHAEALKFFEQVKLKDTQNLYTDRLFLNLGEIHLAQNKFEEAELVSKTFLNNYANSPEVPEAMLLLAEAYRGQKRIDKAVQAYESIIAKDGGLVARAWYQLGEIWMVSDDLTRAAEAYRNVIDHSDRALRDPPEFIQSTYYKLGIVFHLQGRYSESLNMLESGRKRFPENSLRRYADFLIADNLGQLSQPKQAEAELTEMIKAKNGDASLVQDAAAMRLKIMDWEKRLKDRL